MVALFYIVLVILLINVGFIVIVSYLDHKKIRKIKKYPFISFLISTYNDEDYIEETIKSVYDSYDPKKFELFVINDCSKDHTLKILEKINKKYDFSIINNKNNKGKAASINNAFNSTKGDVIVVLDSDMVLNRKAIKDIISRFENPKVGAVSCRYESINKNIFTNIQEVEYNFLALFQASHNIYSTLSLFGVCMAVKREAFKQVGLLSRNAITEDTDLALKLNKNGWKVEQSLTPIRTYAPENLISLYKQKLRWDEGYMQGILTYPRIYFTNPVFILFILISLFLPILAFISYIGNLTGSNLGLLYGSIVGKQINNARLWGFIVYPLFSVPYILLSIKKFSKEFYKIILAYPFVLIYLPVFTLILIQGFIIGFYKYFKLKNKKVGWRG